MRVLMSIGGPTVFETTAAADEILIGTANGVAWLARANGGWRETRRELQGKHVSNLVEDRDRSKWRISEAAVAAQQAVRHLLEHATDLT